MSDDIKWQVEKRVKAEEQKIKKDDPEEVKLTSEFVQSCEFAGQFGDGTLFAHINREKFIFNKQEGRWYAWTGNHWKLDIMNLAHIAVEKCAEAYLAEALKITQQITELGKIKDD